VLHGAWVHGIRSQQCSIVLQDAAVQLFEGRSGFNAQLLGEYLAGAPVGVERVDLPASSISGPRMWRTRACCTRRTR
jgi:hypothetical protein